MAAVGRTQTVSRQTVVDPERPSEHPESDQRLLLERHCSLIEVGFINFSLIVEALRRVNSP